LDTEVRLGYAGDFVHAMWLMLQQDRPEDFVIGTGVAHSVQDLVELAFYHVGVDWPAASIIMQGGFCGERT
jgi:GDPmannose 4,6-dehydratase